MFFLPKTALDQHIAILGKTGSGKTWTAKLVVEHVLKQHRQVCVLDPTGAWYGLRIAADGRGKGFDIVLLGGEHADIPLAERSGAAVARLVTEQGASAVIDTSGFTVGEYTRWFIDFAGTLYTTLRNPLHVVIDEAHYFMPQGKSPDPQAGKMLHAGNRLMSGGRSRGIRGMLITQRPAKLHKDSLTCADTLIAMRVIAPQDRKAIKEWVDGCGNAEDGTRVLGSLATLERGQGWVWYPEGKHLECVTFGPLMTYDSSAAPKHGEKSGPKVAEINLAEVRTALADAVKEAEANDPKLLRAKLADLQRQLKSRPAETKVEKVIERVEVPVLNNGQLDRTEKLAARMEDHGGKMLEEAATLRRMIAPAFAPKEKKAMASNRTTAPVVVRQAPRIAAKASTGNDSNVSRSQQRILDALAWLESVRVPVADKTQVALLADQSPTSGGYFNNLGALRTAGLIEYPQPAMLQLTASGRASAHPADLPTTSEELVEQLCRKLGGSQSAILRRLVSIYPAAIDKSELAEAVGQSPTSGGYFNNLGRLRSLGLIDYPSKGQVAALPVLFLE